MRLTPDVRHQAQALISRRLGLDFPRERQADLQARLLRVFESLPFSSPEACVAWLSAAPDGSAEWMGLAGRFAVGETYFFRDPASFDVLKNRILPSMIAARRSEGSLQLRIWSAGCASGEEPYSLAILLDGLLPDRSAWNVTILATDLNAKALSTARRGIYREWSLRETPRWVRDMYFRRRGGQSYELDPKIRAMVTFATLNLAAECYPDVETNTGAMDLILCRNVLMYFTREAQKDSVARFHEALVNGGWLLVSAVEASVDRFVLFAAEMYPGGLFFRKARLTVEAPPGRPDPTSEPVVPPEPILPAPAAASPQAETSLQRVRSLADRGCLQEARRLCEATLAGDRLNSEGHLLLASICQESGEISTSVESLMRAIYLQPDSAAAHFLLGSLFLLQGQRARGRRCMRNAVSLLSAMPADALVPAGGGLTAGRLLETARRHGESK